VKQNGDIPVYQMNSLRFSHLLSFPAIHGEQLWSDTDRQVSWRKPSILAFAPDSEAVSVSVGTLKSDALLLE
jgi:hypothetical protein